MKTSALSTVTFITFALASTNSFAKTVPPIAHAGSSDVAIASNPPAAVRRHPPVSDISSAPKNPPNDVSRILDGEFLSSPSSLKNPPAQFHSSSKRQALGRPDIKTEALANTIFHGLTNAGPSPVVVLSRDASPNAKNEDPLPQHQATSKYPTHVNGSRHALDHLKSIHPTRREEDDDITDIQYLNFALILEQLQDAYYTQSLNRFSDDDFRKAGYPDWVRGRYKEIAINEKMHREFLESAIIAAGSEHVQPANYDFHDKDVKSFIDTSVAIESIVASAYIGFLQFFNNKAYVTAEASILADRARQAAWINSSVRKQSAWNTAFDTPLTPQQVFTLLSVFFTFDTSPKLNRSLLPPDIRPYPRLILSPRLVPGEQAEISFPYSDDQAEFLYVAFLSGAETIFGRVVDRERTVDGEVIKRYFMDIPRDLASKGVVYVSVVRARSSDLRDISLDDGSIVAGPAITIFPYDATGKAV